MRIASATLLALACSFLAGCSGGGTADLPKDQENQLRNNLSRLLTADEVAHMNGAASGPSAPAGAKKH